MTQGLSAPTATIAREAGISNGSLFTYFETKTVLFNQLYLELKVGMASAALDGMPVSADLHIRFHSVWSNWMLWAVRHPEKRRALALLSVSDEITPLSHETSSQGMVGMAALMEQGQANGPLRGAPFALVASLMNALAEATMDFMVQDPVNAEEHAEVGFDALWRILS